MQVVATQDLAVASARPRPIAHVLLALAVAVLAGIFTGSIQQFGNLSGLTNATTSFDLITASFGALLLPIVHVGVATAWPSMRNARSRREIFFVWSVVITGLHMLTLAMALKTGWLPAVALRDGAQTAAIEDSSQIKPAIDRPQATMAEWDNRLSEIVAIESRLTQPDGTSISQACVRIESSADCLKVEVVRDPFSETREFRLSGREDPKAQSLDPPQIRAVVGLSDGGMPLLWMRPVGAFQISCIDLAIDDYKLDTFCGPRRFEHQKPLWVDGESPLRGITETSAIAARVRFTDEDETTIGMMKADGRIAEDEFPRALSEAGAAQFSADLLTMMEIERALGNALHDVQVAAP